MDQIVIIGMDPHKASNTIAVLDSTENLLTRRRFENSDDGFVEMLAAVAGYPKRVWAVEGANGVGRSIAQRLVGFDERVYDVPAKLATRVRVYSTGHGSKTDNTDALAIARAALHSQHLRIVKPDDETVALKLLSDRRKETCRVAHPSGVSTAPPVTRVDPGRRAGADHCGEGVRPGQ